jgi:hypothetical protein
MLLPFQRFDEVELVNGKFHTILSDCAARLNIPLTADSYFLGNSFLERTQLLLIWDLGEREGRGGEE